MMNVVESSNEMNYGENSGKWKQKRRDGPAKFS